MVFQKPHASLLHKHIIRTQLHNGRYDYNMIRTQSSVPPELIFELFSKIYFDKIKSKLYKVLLNETLDFFSTFTEYRF